VNDKAIEFSAKQELKLGVTNKLDVEVEVQIFTIYNINGKH